MNKKNNVKKSLLKSMASVVKKLLDSMLTLFVFGGTISQRNRQLSRKCVSSDA